MTQQEFTALKPKDEIVLGGEATFVVIEANIQLTPCPHRSIAHRIRGPKGKERNYCWCSYGKGPMFVRPLSSASQ